MGSPGAVAQLVRSAVGGEWRSPLHRCPVLVKQDSRGLRYWRLLGLGLFALQLTHFVMTEVHASARARVLATCEAGSLELGDAPGDFTCISAPPARRRWLPRGWRRRKGAVADVHRGDPSGDVTGGLAAETGWVERAVNTFLVLDIAVQLLTGARGADRAPLFAPVYILGGGDGSGDYHSHAPAYVHSWWFWLDLLALIPMSLPPLVYRLLQPLDALMVVRICRRHPAVLVRTLRWALARRAPVDTSPGERRPAMTIHAAVRGRQVRGSSRGVNVRVLDEASPSPPAKATKAGAGSRASGDGSPSHDESPLVSEICAPSPISMQHSSRGVIGANVLNEPFPSTPVKLDATSRAVAAESPSNDESPLVSEICAPTPVSMQHDDRLMPDGSPIILAVPGHDMRRSLSAEFRLVDEPLTFG